MTSLNLDLWNSDRICFYMHACTEKKFTAPILKALDKEPQNIGRILQGKKVALYIPRYMEGKNNHYQVYVKDQNNALEVACKIETVLQKGKLLFFRVFHGNLGSHGGYTHFSAEIGAIEGDPEVVFHHYLSYDILKSEHYLGQVIFEIEEAV